MAAASWEQRVKVLNCFFGAPKFIKCRTLAKDRQCFVIFRKLGIPNDNIVNQKSVVSFSYLTK